MSEVVKKVCYLLVCVFFAALLNSCHRKVLITHSSSVIKLAQNDFTMIHLPKATVPAGPTGRTNLEDRPDFLIVKYPLRLAKTNTTYALWKKVYSWGEEHGYRFNRPGQPGTQDDGEGMNERHPVTVVDWPSVVVWCNALTEYYNELYGSDFKPVYHYDGQVARTAPGHRAQDSVDMVETADGFRLPTGPEWELAARYTTVNREGYREFPRKSGVYWKPWLVVSGELENRGGRAGEERGRIVSVEVDKTAVNDLGFYGMEGPEGKLWQWCFEYLGSTKEDSFRLKMGGSRWPRCTRHDNWPKTKWHHTCGAYNQITFRIAQTVFDSTTTEGGSLTRSP
jgi:formylglycine-generating enzyme required for sulfatase activity